MKRFISCDWGTSALRLRLVDTTSMVVTAEATTINGISTTFESWKKSDVPEKDKPSFYLSVLAEQIKELEKQSNLLLENIPVVISGMASSSIGMIELPYKEIPFSIDGHDLNIELIEATHEFNHSMLLISGAKTNDDAMRGEETQLIGCINGNNREEGLFIFPGTHSKHITVRNAKAVDVKTYMTGEFFELLSKKSILSNNVESSDDILNADNATSFDKGVLDSLQLNILHSLFRVRTNDLFGKLSKKENYYYLSGLLIGAELREIVNVKMPITIVGDETLIKYYTTALIKLGVHGIKYQDAAKAVINGQCRLFNLYQSKIKQTKAPIDYNEAKLKRT